MLPLAVSSAPLPCARDDCCSDVKELVTSACARKLVLVQATVASFLRAFPITTSHLHILYSPCYSFRSRAHGDFLFIRFVSFRFVLLFFRIPIVLLRISIAVVIMDNRSSTVLDVVVLHNTVDFFRA